MIGRRFWDAALALGVALALLVVGCGSGTYLVLTVDGPFEIPTEIDALQLTITEPDTQIEIALIDIPLEASDRLPSDIVLAPVSTTLSPLQIQVIGQKCDYTTDCTDVAEVIALVTWVANADNRIQLPPLRRIR